MAILLLSLAFVLVTVPFPIDAGYSVDILPDFVGYLLLWFFLEKRKFNGRFSLASTLSAVFAAVTFLLCLTSFRYLFTEFLERDGLIIGWILQGLAFLSEQASPIFPLFGCLIAFLLYFGLLARLNSTNERPLAILFCKIGIGVCAALTVCQICALFLILPFSWNYLTLPLSALILLLFYLSAKDDREFNEGRIGD